MRPVVIGSLVFTACLVATSVFLLVRYLNSGKNQVKEELVSVPERVVATEQFYTFGLVSDDSLVFPRLDVRVKLSGLYDKLQQVTCPSKKVISLSPVKSVEGDGTVNGFAKSLKKEVDEACGKVSLDKVIPTTNALDVKFGQYYSNNRETFVTCTILSDDKKTNVEIKFELKIQGYVYVKKRNVIRHMKQYKTRVEDTTAFCKEEVQSLFAVLGGSFNPFA
jgi:hypothetical protein